MPNVLLIGQPPAVVAHPALAGMQCIALPDVAAMATADISACDVLVIGGMLRLHAHQLDQLPALRLIAVHGVGYDGVPLAACRTRGITVTNTPDVLTEDVADLAMALTLMTLRRLGASERYLRAGRWEQERFPLGRALAGRTLGIVGLGRIGKAVAARAMVSGMRIAYHGRSPQAVPHRYYPTLLELATAADVLVITVPGGEGTAGLIDAAVLDALGPSGFLINVARGSVVDEPALITALQEQRIAGAGLDVFAQEPHVPEALRTLENVVLLPHMGSATTDTRQAMADLVVANITAFAEGRPLPTAVAL